MTVMVMMINTLIADNASIQLIYLSATDIFGTVFYNKILNPN